MLTPKRLLRVYPPLWRVRYGDEFLALLASAPITRRVIVDVARSAAREWYENTFVARAVLAPIVSTAALGTALALAALIQTPPIMTVVLGQELLSPPWPTWFGFLMPVVMFLSLVSFCSAFIKPNRIRLQFSTTFWVLATYIAAATSAWGELVRHDGTGVPPSSFSDIWWRYAIVVFNCLTFSFIARTSGRRYFANLSWPKPPRS